MFGSLPPAGRDLDLLTRPDDASRLAASLEKVGAIRRGSTWAIFATGEAYAVDLVDVSSWGLADAELEALYGQATLVEGSAVLLEPAPAHALLLLARQGIAPKREARLRAAVAEPGARAEAESRASAWGVDLTRLEHPPRRRPPLGPPTIVALSGLDGSGKSTQATALASSLRAAGLDVHVEWTPILQNRSVAALSAFARALASRTGVRKAAAEGRSLVAQVEGGGKRAAIMRSSWTVLISTINGFAHRRAALRHRGRETVVIYDRFVLDSVVRLRHLYGRDESFALPRRIVSFLSPTADVAFWLDVPAERAYARKPEHWDVRQLSAQRELYADEYERLGVRRLDGERQTDDLAAEIAAAVWSSA